MKRSFVVLLILLILFGCSSKTDDRLDEVYRDETYDIALLVAKAHVENNLGYNSEFDYTLCKINLKQEYPIVYQIEIQNTLAFQIEFDFTEEFRYGGYHFEYKNGYLCPYIKDQDFGRYTEKDYLYSVLFNESMEYEEYKTIEMIPLSEQDQLHLEQVIEDLIVSKALSSDLSDVRLIDKVTFGKPMASYQIELNEEKKVIEAVQKKALDCPVYVDDQLEMTVRIFLDEKDSYIWIVERDEQIMTLLMEGKSFARVNTSFFSQQFIVTEEKFISSGQFYPLYVDWVVKEIQKHLNS